MPRARLEYDWDHIYTEKELRINKLTDEIEYKIDHIPSVIDNVTTVDSDNALSANMGKYLQDQINNLTWVATFLSTWDCTTGTPATEPVQDPYRYKAWNYYIVSRVADETQWEFNYEPYWWVYHHWQQSTEREYDEIEVNDWYIFDWNRWLIQSAWKRTITIDPALDQYSTNPVENRAIYYALGTKQDVILDLDAIRAWAYRILNALEPGDPVSLLLNDVNYQTLTDVLNLLNSHINVKAFKLNAINDYADAQAAYDWFKVWKLPVVLYEGWTYVPVSSTVEEWEWEVVLYDVHSYTASALSGWARLQNDKLTFTITLWNVTTIVKAANEVGAFLSTNVQNWAYTPTYNYDPATKKYVDDIETSLTNIINQKQNSLEPWQNIYFTWDNNEYINAIDTTYIAWTGIDITNEVVTNTWVLSINGQTWDVDLDVNVEWWEITWDITDQQDLMDLLDWIKWDINTKTFNLWSIPTASSAKETFLEALEWMNDNKNAILIFDWRVYLFDRLESSDTYYFVSPQITKEIDWTTYDRTHLHQKWLEILISYNPDVYVERITPYEFDTEFLETDWWYSYDYTPTFPWDPATKGYVDSAVPDIHEWNNIYFTYDSNDELYINAVDNDTTYSAWDYIEITNWNEINNTKPFIPNNPSAWAWLYLKKVNSGNGYEWAQWSGWGWGNYSAWYWIDIDAYDEISNTLAFDPDNPSTADTWQILTKTDYWYEWADAPVTSINNQHWDITINEFNPGWTQVNNNVLTWYNGTYAWLPAQGWWGWSSNVKLFVLSWLSDLTTAQAAYDFYAMGWDPIIRIYQTLSYTASDWIHSVTGYYDYTRRPQIWDNWWSQAVPWSNWKIEFLLTYSPFDDVSLINDSYHRPIEHGLIFWLNVAEVIKVETESQTYMSTAYLSPNYDYSEPYMPQYPGSPATKKYVDDKNWIWTQAEYNILEQSWQIQAWVIYNIIPVA